MENSNNSDFSLGAFPPNPLEKMLHDVFEENRTREAEAEFRYQSRKNRKEEYCSQIEQAAIMICNEVIARMGRDREDMEEFEIEALAAALGHAAAAMHAAESYSQMRPIFGSMLGGA